MLKILVIGDEGVTLPFRAVGIEAVFADNFKVARQALFEAAKREYGIIFIAESVAQGCLDLIREISESKALPIITIIPDLLLKEKGAAEQRLQELIRKAVGMELPE